MKLKQLISLTLASSMLALSIPQRANSSPAILAPAICAGTAGIGCVVIGVATVGGILYYVWSNGKTRQGISDSGSVLRSEYLEDPENIQEEWDYGVKANNESEAAKKCREYAKRERLILNDDNPPSYDKVRKEFICKMRGVV
jgi:hypothetical protein